MMLFQKTEVGTLVLYVKMKKWFKRQTHVLLKPQLGNAYFHMLTCLTLHRSETLGNLNMYSFLNPSRYLLRKNHNKILSFKVVNISNAIIDGYIEISIKLKYQ